MAHATNTPQAAPHAAPQGRRGSKPLQHAFTFSPPGHNRPQSAKKRSKTLDDYSMPEDDYDNDSPRKGGHSLRKRARVDYTFEQIDDDVVVPNSSAASSSRNKKRRPDQPFDSEELFGPGMKRRGASLDADTPSNRRRNPSRKSSEARGNYREDAEDDENDVQDTIEVGVLLSDIDQSDVPHLSHSDASSPDLSPGAPQKSTPTLSQLDGVYTSRNADNLADPGSEKGPVSPTNKMHMGDSSRNSPQLPAQGLSPQLPNDDLIDPQLKFEEPEIPNGHDAPVGRVSGSPPPQLQQQPQQRSQSPPPPNNQAATQEEPSVIITTEDSATDAPEIVQSASVLEDAPAELSKSFTEDTVVHVLQEQKEPEEIRQASPLPQARSKSPEPTTNIDDKTEPNDAEDKHVAQNDHAAESSSSQSAANGLPQSLSPPSPDAQQQPEAIPVATFEAETAVEPSSSATEELVGTPVRQAESILVKPVASRTQPEPAGPQIVTQSMSFRPQPRPVGRWAHLTPYVDGEHVSYPEKKGRFEDEVVASEDQTPEDKDIDRDASYMEPMVDDNDEGPDPASGEALATALNTPMRGSPVPDSIDPTAPNSPVPVGDDAYDVEISESQEPPERTRYFKYRKLRDPEEYISAIENFEDMSTADLYEIMEAINISLVQWQSEWNDLGKVVDDYENSLRRRIADSKYESRTRNFHQHGINYEEPDFAVKGYKAKDKDSINETRYLQAQDRIMASTYGFEYDPHPSKIGRQNPETQQSGIMTRGRSLRNQPKPTAKATEADEVTGKRQRKPVQLFDPASQDISRSSTPVPTRGRRRKNANADEDNQPTANSSFNGDANSDGEIDGPKMRRRRGPRPKMAVPSIIEELVPHPADDSIINDSPSRPSRRGRAKQPIRYDDEGFEYRFVEEEPRLEKPHRRRHLLTLKIPRGKHFSEPSSAITDNGDSRPSTASSDSTSHTAESSYSFRPKRQKRFRDNPDDSEEAGQAPPKKKGKYRSNNPSFEEEILEFPDPLATEAALNASNRKVHKIKVVRAANDSRKGTPVSLPNTEDGDEGPKDYKSMTKSEKMSASMKSKS